MESHDDDYILRADGIVKTFGGARALDDACLQVRTGEVHLLLGPNGAGKTTLFNVVSGVYGINTGTLDLAGTSLVGKSPHAIASLGVSRSFQNLQLIPSRNAAENVAVGFMRQVRSRMLGAALGIGEQRKYRRRLAMAHTLLDSLGGVTSLTRPVGELSFGEQRVVEVARALSTRPRVLLLDEPAAGLTNVERLRLQGVIRSLREQDITVVLVEHDMKFAMGLADRVTVLDVGRTLATGTVAEIQEDPRVIEAYLGSRRRDD